MSVAPLSVVRSVLKGPGLRSGRTKNGWGCGVDLHREWRCLLRGVSLDGLREQGRAGPKANIGVLGVLRGFEDHLLIGESSGRLSSHSGWCEGTGLDLREGCGKRPE